MKYFKIDLNKVDKLYNTLLNRKNVTYFFTHGKIHITNNKDYKKPLYFHNWDNLVSQIYGVNKKLCRYILNYIGCNVNISFTNLDEFFFLFFREFMKNYNTFISLNWFLLFLKERECLAIFVKGKRFYRRYPCRGQRTRSNYKTCKKRQWPPKYIDFKKTLSRNTAKNNFPTWRKIETFYFHRF